MNESPTFGASYKPLGWPAKKVTFRIGVLCIAVRKQATDIKLGWGCLEPIRPGPPGRATCP